MVFIGQKQEQALFTRHVAQSYPCNRSDCNSLVAVRSRVAYLGYAYCMACYQGWILGLMVCVVRGYWATWIHEWPLRADMQHTRLCFCCACRESLSVQRNSLSLLFAGTRDDEAERHLSCNS